MLAAAPVGEVMFRPSLKGPDHMTACIKLSETGPLLHVNILMEDKKAPAEIGNKLIIGRDAAKGSAGEVFHDLDEICARYVEPLVESVREAAKHRKFAAEPAAEVEAKLKKEKEDSPQSIPYALMAHHQSPEYLCLAFVPRTSVHKEYIKMTPTGFVYRNESFSTLEKLIKWFKNNWNKPVEQKRQPRGGGGWR